MAKEIAEELKNYNKYPGELVVLLPEDLVKIGDKSFRLIKNFREGFDSLALEQRYGHVFDKFDYIVGDWGHELLRLRGFYENNHKHVENDEKISHLADYLQEYCAFGAKYFVLHRERAENEVDAPFVADKEDLQAPKKSRQNQQNRNRGGRDDNRRSRETNRDLGFSTVRPDGKPVDSTKPKSKSKSDRQNNKNNNNKNGKKSEKSEKKPETKQRNRRTRNALPQKSEKKFTIRERKD